MVVNAVHDDLVPFESKSILRASGISKILYRWGKSRLIIEGEQLIVQYSLGKDKIQLEGEYKFVFI